MTKTQRHAVDTINAVRNNFHRRFHEEIKRDLAGFLPENATPSEWVNVNTLTVIHHVSRAAIKALVKQGVLEMQPTDGFGDEVQIVNPAFIWR